MSSVIKPTNPIAQLLWEDARKFIVKASELTSQTDTNRRLPEALFLQHFLGFFAGEVPAEHINDLRTIWIDIAGDAFSAVDIVGDSGVVVATVPSLGDRNAIRLTVNNEQERMGSVAHNARQKLTISPVLSDSILMNALSDKFLEKDTEKLNTAKKEEWEKLLRHYGKSLDKTKAVAGVSVVGGKHNVTDDDFE